MSSNVISAPTIMEVSTEELQIALSLKFSDGDTYKGRPLSHFLKPYFETES